eukprot:4529902-Amphidinium_carterae.1
MSMAIGVETSREFWLLTVEEVRGLFKRTPRELGMTAETFFDEEGGKFEGVAILKAAGDTYCFRTLKVWFKQEDARLHESYQKEGASLRSKQGEELFEFIKDSKVRGGRSRPLRRA